MTRRRWIADEIKENRAFLHGQNAEHLAHVLRAHIGQEFEIVAGDKLFLGRIAEISSRQVAVDLLSEIDQTSPGASTQIHLFLALFKFDRMEWAIEKATELGVTSIVPVIARRSDAHLTQAAEKRIERWRRIVHEAAQQSRRSTVPDVREPVKLRQALQTAEGCRIVLSEYEKERPLVSVLQESGPGEPIVIAIGPEGGWTEDELAAFAAAGWVAASLGPAILRAETAAIAALAIANSVGK